MDSIKEKWEEILDYVKKEHDLSDVSFKTWLKPLSVYKIENSTVIIFVPSEKLGLEYINKKYSVPLKVAIFEVTGFDVELSFITKEDIDNGNETQKEFNFSEHGLNPRYTFNTFVVGKNNEFAHAAALAVAESPGDLYNPLFLYGGVGLGKTHLMQSIAFFIKEHRPELKILYTTSEEYTNQVIEAIRNGSSSVLSRFREKYRTADVLLIDDIQFIIGKESTQEEFFHTFNALHSAGKQIIISSDRPPKDMDILEERIKSRFEWGLMADIQSPDYETRIAILKNKLKMDGHYVNNEVIEYIASNVKTNIRELEGSLNKVMAVANLEKKEITVDLAKNALKDIITPTEKKAVTADMILEEVSSYFGVTTEDLKGEKRSSKIVYPRKIAMYLIRELTNNTLESIGVIMGGKHHTSVAYNIEDIEKKLQTSEETSRQIEALKKRITG